MKRFLIIFALAVLVIIGLMAIDFWLFDYFKDGLIYSFLSMIFRVIGLSFLGLVVIISFK
jgi:hypothetical protein